MSLLINLLSVLFLALPLQDGKKFMIMGMNSNYIIIDSQIKTVGDTYEEGAEVWWCFNSQYIEVMDINTSDMYRHSAKDNPSKKPKLEDFIGYKEPLSTNDEDDSIVMKEAPVGYFYVIYKLDGKDKSDIVSLDIDKNILPSDTQLYYKDPGASTGHFLTNDFHGFLKSLAETDRVVKAELSKRDYYMGEEQKLMDDYMRLMRMYADPRFSNITYTYNELKLLLKL